MGFIANALTGQSSFQAQAPDKPVNDAEALDAYNKAQDAIKQQAAFVQALQGQNGIQNQSNVFNQLQDVATGTGPNPATAMLNNATGANVANQAALMAGQRGASANPGLIARQAAQAGGALQQNAAGQAAALQANQSLNALNSMGNIAGQQVNNQGNAISGLNSASQNEQGALLNSIAGANNAQNTASQINAGMAQNNANNLQSTLGGLFQGAGTLGAASGIFGKGAQAAQQAGNLLAKGGEVNGPKSKAGQHLHSAKNMKSGGHVPGKASVGGDSYKNDTVPAVLSPGEIVIPRSVTTSKDAPKKAAEFVAEILRKKQAKK